MEAFKEKQFLIFKLDNGQEVKYDLSKSCFIGKSGKVVKSISSYLSGYTIQDVIESFSDENFRNFLKFLNLNFVNVKQQRNYWGTKTEGTRIKNIGTFLSKISYYLYFEQYFSAGIKKIDPNFHVEVKDLPKGYLNFLKKFDKEANNKTLLEYTYNVDNYNLINKLIDEKKFNSLTRSDLDSILIIPAERTNYWSGIDSNKQYVLRNSPEYQTILQQRRYYPGPKIASDIFYILCNTYNYNKMRLLEYIDDLLTFEGITNLIDLLRELEDYNCMLTEMSPTRKYEKYPKYFLSMHTITVRNYNRLVKAVYPAEKFEERVKKDWEFSYNDYRFIYPNTDADIKEEAVMQNNCVASYINRVIDGKCDIMFLRNKDNLKHSLVTLEIREWKVVQAKAKFNSEPSEDEWEAIHEFDKFLLKKKKEYFTKKAKELQLGTDKGFNMMTNMTKKLEKKS